MRRFLLDSSFVIDLLNEEVERCHGPAGAWLHRNPRARLWISPVTLAEVLEGAEDRGAVKIRLARYKWQGIGHAHAERVALRQSRSSQRMSENDAWQAAVAESLDAAIVGHDPKAFGRLGTGYVDHRLPA
jgi:predicted nucleic acid-binding protein